MASDRNRSLLFRFCQSCVTSSYQFQKSWIGLVFPSEQVVKIVNTCEKVFRVAVIRINKKEKRISSKKDLKLLMVPLINQELANEIFFKSYRTTIIIINISLT